MTGFSSKLLSGQIRLAGARRNAAPEPADKSNEGHRGQPWPGSDRPGPAPSQVFTHLAAGLRMVGPGMADLDPEQAEFDLQGDAALAALFDGEDGSVVGQHAGWGAPLAKGCAEAGYHVAALGDSPGIGGQAESGMVVDDVEDSEPEGARRGVSGRKDGFFLDT